MRSNIDAFDDALGKTLKAVVVWTLEAGEHEKSNAKVPRK